MIDRMILSSKNKLILTAVGFLFLSSCQTPKPNRNPDFLWNTINEKCVPGQKAKNNPEPCIEVTLEKDGQTGFVVYKDFHGPLQYLLMPASKITGMESAELLKDDALNYFYLAWQARAYMEKLYKAAIPPEEISLTLNSQQGRSQNQMHIHISCTRPDIKEQLHKNLDSLGKDWKQIPGGVLGHNYFWRRISLQQFKEQNILKLLANDFPEAKDNMGEFSVGVVPIKNAKGDLDFAILADRAVLVKLDRGHVEEIQDHSCPQLYVK
jgi:CDP-diacylglycerol pyrophosphatase